MKNIQLFIILFFNICLSSCQLILKWAWKVSEPTPVSYEKLLNYYQKKYNIKDSLCFYITQKDIDSLKNYPYKTGWSNGFRPLQFKVFNNEGQLICQYSTCEGKLEKLGILNSFPPNAIRQFPFLHDTSYSIIDENKIVKSYCGKRLNSSDCEVLFIVYSAKWMGKSSLNLYRKVQRYKNKYPNHLIKIVLVNVAEMN